MGNWAWSLYKELGPDGDRSVTHEQAKRWLSDVENNLCMALEIIDFVDMRQALCTLAYLMQLGLEHVVALVEGIWGIFQEAGKLRRREEGERGRRLIKLEEGERGRLLIKLEEAIGNVLSERGAGLKSARSTRGPEKYGGDDQQEGDYCQHESCPTEPDLREEGGASLAAGLESPDLGSASELERC